MAEFEEEPTSYAVLKHKKIFQNKIKKPNETLITSTPPNIVQATETKIEKNNEGVFKNPIKEDSEEIYEEYPATLEKEPGKDDYEEESSISRESSVRRRMKTPYQESSELFLSSAKNNEPKVFELGGYNSAEKKKHMPSLQSSFITSDSRTKEERSREVTLKATTSTKRETTPKPTTTTELEVTTTTSGPQAEVETSHVSVVQQKHNRKSSKIARKQHKRHNRLNRRHKPRRRKKSRKHIRAQKRRKHKNVKTEALSKSVS